MLPFYAACDVICVPSGSEAFGRTIIEAMAGGVPVVATRVGGIPEIIDDGDCGNLVEFGDGVELRDRVRRLLGSAGPVRYWLELFYWFSGESAVLAPPPILSDNAIFLIYQIQMHVTIRHFVLWL